MTSFSLGLLHQKFYNLAVCQLMIYCHGNLCHLLISLLLYYTIGNIPMETVEAVAMCSDITGPMM